MRRTEANNMTGVIGAALLSDECCGESNDKRDETLKQATSKLLPQGLSPPDAIKNIWPTITNYLTFTLTVVLLLRPLKKGGEISCVRGKTEGGVVTW